ncbi:MAG: hypothetical protein KatS3mg110_1714 [Pirellulaceae bacterium]|nr:MAG: hypothetical protein KatS3mg110_1714 [Pirellulaceae bacterium]
MASANYRVLEVAARMLQPARRRITGESTRQVPSAVPTSPSPSLAPEDVDCRKPERHSFSASIPAAPPLGLYDLFKWSLTLGVACSLFTFAQLCSPCLWTWLTGQGVYTRPALAKASLVVFVAGVVASLAVKPKPLADLDHNPFLVWARRLASIAAATIVYPALYHFYYDIPPLLFWAGGTIAFGLCLATWVSLRWIVALNLFVSLAIGSFLNVPHFLWDITDLRHTLNAINLLCAAVATVPLWSKDSPGVSLKKSGEAPQNLPEGFLDAVILLMAVAFTIPYFYAGAGKVFVCSRTPWIVDGISWIWQERLDKFFELFYYFGFTWLSPAFPPEHVASLLASPWIRIPACTIVLAGELAMLSLFWSRRLLLFGIVCCQLLHIGFTFLAGTYFIHWFAWNIFFMVFWTAGQYRRYAECLTPLRRLAATVIVVLALPVIFHSSVLAWGTDRSTYDVYAWYGVWENRAREFSDGTEKMRLVRINPNTFFPYEKNFQMSWRFDRYFTSDPLQAGGAIGESFWKRWFRWYKLRAVGEWHESLRRPLSTDEIRAAVKKLVERWLERERSLRSPRLPYYTHITANRAFFSPFNKQTEKLNQFRLLLARTTYRDQGVMRSEPLVTTTLLEESFLLDSDR